MTFLLWARVVFAVLLAIVTYLTVTPNPDDVGPSLDIMRWIARVLFGDEGLGDKVAHFTAYGTLGASAALARIKLGGKAAFAVIALAAYGAALEGVQALGGVRDPELLDALANATGASIGYPALAMFLQFFRTRARA